MQGQSPNEVEISSGTLRRSVSSARTVLCALTVSALIVLAMPALASNATVRTGVHLGSARALDDCDPDGDSYFTAHHHGDSTTTDPDDVCPTTTTTTTTVPPTTTTAPPPPPPP